MIVESFMAADAREALSRPFPVAVPARYRLPMALDFRIVGALEVAEDSFGPPRSSSLLLVGFSSCGTRGRGVLSMTSSPAG